VSLSVKTGQLVLETSAASTSAFLHIRHVNKKSGKKTRETAIDLFCGFELPDVISRVDLRWPRPTAMHVTRSFSLSAKVLSQETKVAVARVRNAAQLTRRFRP
jgi:hypothetical protein